MMGYGTPLGLVEGMNARMAIRVREDDVTWSSCCRPVGGRGDM